MLVSKPEAVSVEQFEEDDGTVVLELSVGDDDYGRVIGRGGRTANALRTVVKAAAVTRAQARARRHRRLSASCAPAGSAGRTGSTAPSTSTEPRPELLVVGTPCARRARAAIVARKGTDAKPILRVDARRDRTGGRGAARRDAARRATPRPPLGEDEYWAEDLEGCAVVDGDRALGMVAAAARAAVVRGARARQRRRSCRSCATRARRSTSTAKRIEVDAGFLGAA